MCRASYLSVLATCCKMSWSILVVCQDYVREFANLMFFYMYDLIQHVRFCGISGLFSCTNKMVTDVRFEIWVVLPCVVNALTTPGRTYTQKCWYMSIFTEIHLDGWKCSRKCLKCSSTLCIFLVLNGLSLCKIPTLLYH